MEKFQGTGVALVTPFNADSSVDFDGLSRLLEFTGEAVDYYVVLGTTGESATTSPEEKARNPAVRKGQQSQKPSNRLRNRRK